MLRCMSLLLAHFGHGAMSDLSPLSGVERKFDLEAVRSALDPGCVKTPTFNLRVEIPSRFRKFENQKCLRPLLREDDRENNSAHSWLLHVFTQPGPEADIGSQRLVPIVCPFSLAAPSQSARLLTSVRLFQGNQCDGASSSRFSAARRRGRLRRARSAKSL